jgi:peptidoglycan/xylan/chitin deacetylase (PgdA/CDA1 family)
LNPSFFVISLDFELHWGRFDKVPLIGNERYYLRARDAVPRLCREFEDYEIAATWATVGMLFAENADELHAYSPIKKPTYHNNLFSAYRWLEGRHVDTKMLFAPDLIAEVLLTPRQELGSHTYAHYYTRELGHSAESFRADLQAAQKIARDKFDVGLTSLVFPRNQYDADAIAIAAEEGFNAVRSNPEDWYWRDSHDEQLLKKVFRTGDTVLPLGKKSSYPASLILPLDFKLPFTIAASRFFRPYQGFMPMLDRWKVDRIKREMTRAAKLGEVYHLWWHPHNHGHHFEQTFQELRMILDHYRFLHDTMGMESVSMRGLRDEFV